MKCNYCTTREKVAYENIIKAGRWLVRELEKGLANSAKGSEEYLAYESKLNDHRGLVNQLFEIATTNCFNEGSTAYRPANDRFLKAIRFCDRTWLLNRCEYRINKLGY